MLPRFSRCILAFLKKFVHALSHSCKIWFTWRICQRERLFPIKSESTAIAVRNLYISLKQLNELIKFLFICLISSFHCTVGSSKIVILFGLFNSIPLAQV